MPHQSMYDFHQLLEAVRDEFKVWEIHWTSCRSGYSQRVHGKWSHFSQYGFLAASPGDTARIIVWSLENTELRMLTVAARLLGVLYLKKSWRHLYHSKHIAISSPLEKVSLTYTVWLAAANYCLPCRDAVDSVQDWSRCVFFLLMYQYVYNKYLSLTTSLSRYFLLAAIPISQVHVLKINLQPGVILVKLKLQFQSKAWFSKINCAVPH